VRGIHSGDFLGFPATGRQVVWREMFTSRFRDDMIAEDWAVTELAERLLLSRKR
jgi:predicted ester cyclase